MLHFDSVLDTLHVRSYTVVQNVRIKKLCRIP